MAILEGREQGREGGEEGEGREGGGEGERERGGREKPRVLLPKHRVRTGGRGENWKLIGCEK